VALVSGVFRPQSENNQTTYLARLWNRFLFFGEWQKFMTLTHFQWSSKVLCVRQKVLFTHQGLIFHSPWFGTCQDLEQLSWHLDL
jgi:hypothetical protein